MTDDAARRHDLNIRQALLMIVDSIERRWGMPRTAELRKQLKAMQRDGQPERS